MEASQVKPEVPTSAPAQPEKQAPKFKAPKKKRKWPKRVIILVVIVAVLALALSRCMNAGSQIVSSAYLPYTAEMRDMTVSVSGTGTIEPIHSYKVTTLVSGEILEAPFEEGQTVHKGDVLFRIDSKDVESNIEQLQLNVQSAQLALNDLLKNQSDNQKDRSLKAEDAGVITKLYVEQGDSVSIGAPIADVLDRDHMKLKVPFHAADAAGFYVGQTATVVVDGTAQSLTGTVDEIAATDEVGPGGTLVRQVTIRRALRDQPRHRQRQRRGLRLGRRVCLRLLLPDHRQGRRRCGDPQHQRGRPGERGPGGGHALRGGPGQSDRKRPHRPGDRTALPEERPGEAGRLHHHLHY